MGSPKGLVYALAAGGGWRIFVTHDPALDRAYWQDSGEDCRLFVLSFPLPQGIAHSLQQRLAGKTWPTGEAGLAAMAGLLAKETRRWLTVLPDLRLVENGWEEVQPDRRTLPDAESIDQVRAVLTGRVLLLPEVARALHDRGVYPAAPLVDVLQVLYLAGEVERRPGVVWDGLGGSCARCGQAGEIHASPCADCGTTGCIYCAACAAMGEARQCRPLFLKPGLEAITGQPRVGEVHLGFELTPAQADASLALVDSLYGQGKDCLVWAACGAGKTEVAFQAIARALEDGYRVMVAIPRRDVVRELEPRLAAAFPLARIAALYGGAPDKFRDADLVVATTHQALRFYQQFYLVVLDEVDAFPYHGNPMLYLAVDRARRPGGRTLYLTATPPVNLREMAVKGELGLVYLPARPHGYPLPEPEIVLARALSDRGGRSILAPEVLEIIHRSVEGDMAQVFVFVPTVYMASRVGEILRESLQKPPYNFPGDWVQYAHARDPDRERKREAFTRGDFPVLVTTTIMERGVTIPRVNVAVLFAEDERVFDEGTLVQMAGRSGRSALHPAGRVWFVGSRRSRPMLEARRHIRYLNQEAGRRGYLVSRPETGRGGC